MSRAFAPVVLTANDLLDGDAVWWTGSGWSRALAAAAVFADEAEAAAAEARATGAVVGLYRVEVVPGPVPVPALRRERIRAEGRPSFDYLAPAHLRDAA